MVRVLDNDRGRIREVVEAVRTDGGNSALQLAAGNQQLEMCSYLVETLGVDVNAADNDGLFLSFKCSIDRADDCGTAYFASRLRPSTTNPSRPATGGPPSRPEVCIQQHTRRRRQPVAAVQVQALALAHDGMHASPWPWGLSSPGGARVHAHGAPNDPANPCRSSPARCSKRMTLPIRSVHSLRHATHEPTTSFHT